MNVWVLLDGPGTVLGVFDDHEKAIAHANTLTDNLTWKPGRRDPSQWIGTAYMEMYSTQPMELNVGRIPLEKRA
jgi:hypothetical protein